MNSTGTGRVEEEIQRERAETLGRAGERLEEALGALRTLRERIERAGGGQPECSGAAGSGDTAEAGAFEEYRGLLARAHELRHILIIQREAIGLRRHEDVDRQYPIPPAPASRGETLGEERR